MWVLAILLTVTGYILGSIPTAYLAGRWVKGIDLRRHGSGTVSGSMVWEHVARWALFPVGIFDIFKGVLPVWLCLWLGLNENLAALAGLAAVAGHNWPIFLGFTGGRGLSPFLGVLLVMFPWGIPWMLSFLAVGYLLGDSAPWALGSLLLLPLYTRWLDGPVPIAWAALFMVALTVTKRLEANRRPLPKEKQMRRTMLLRRVLLDRDISSHKEWINRQS